MELVRANRCGRVNFASIRKLNMRKKILHVINSLVVGGAEILLVNSLSAGGLPEYADNYLVYFQGTSSLLDRIDPRVKVFCLDYKGRFGLPGALSRLRKLIKENNIDVVHTHLNPAGFYTHLVCPANIPQVHTVHIAYSTDIETKPTKLFLEKHLYFQKKRTNIIFLSEFTQDDFLKAVNYKGRSFILNNFVSDDYFNETKQEYGHERNSLKLVAVGRLDPQKNFEYLLDVLTHLKDREIYLDIYGGGDASPYEQRIRETGIKVKMMGQHMRLHEILPGHDLFIMPSINEGFPLSVFEAMASGLPVMLSNIAPLTSIVHDNAIYFELNDAKKVADQLVAILEKKTDINGLTKKAKDYAEITVRKELYMNKLMSIYDQL